MADISQIKIPNGTTYDIKDANARERIEVLESSTPSGGDIETYTLATFNETLIPATAPFIWYIAGGNKTTASASYTSYMPLIENRTSRKSYSYPACYLFRKIEGGKIYAVFTNPHYTTVFIRIEKSGYTPYWICTTPMPGGGFLFTMSDSTPTLKFVTFSYSNNLYGSYDTETLLTNNSDKIINAHFEANIYFGGINDIRSMRVPITLSPDGDVFTFVYYSSGVAYRILCRRTGVYAWTATATAL